MVLGKLLVPKTRQDISNDEILFGCVNLSGQVARPKNMVHSSKPTPALLRFSSLTRPTTEGGHCLTPNYKQLSTSVSCLETVKKPNPMIVQVRPNSQNISFHLTSETRRTRLLFYDRNNSSSSHVAFESYGLSLDIHFEFSV